MGTSYTILQSNKVELSVDEHSNKLDLAMAHLNGYGEVQMDLEIRDLSPEQLRDIGKRLIEIAEYYL